MAGSLLHAERPRHRDAYRHYLMLGSTRTIEKLHERLIEQWGERDAPEVGTLYNWSRNFGWESRLIEDDEAINRRALDRIRDRMAKDIERRRSQRLQTSDIMMTAVKNAIVTEKDGAPIIIDLKATNAQTIRAINDTFKLAAETQRLDSGEATARLAGEEMNMGEGLYRVMTSEESTQELARFIGIVQEEDGRLEYLDGEVVDVDENGQPTSDTGAA